MEDIVTRTFFRLMEYQRKANNAPPPKVGKIILLEFLRWNVHRAELGPMWLTGSGWEIISPHNCKQRCLDLLLIVLKHEPRWVRFEPAALILRDTDVYDCSTSNGALQSDSGGWLGGGAHLQMSMSRRATEKQYLSQHL